MESLKHEQVVMKQKQEALSQVILNLIILSFCWKYSYQSHWISLDLKKDLSCCQKLNITWIQI